MTCAQNERRHTVPHEYCDRPEYWHSADGDSTETEVSELVAGLVRALQPEIVVETGTAFGYTTLLIGEALRENGHGYLYSLEIDPARVEHATAMLDADPLPLPVSIVQTSSLTWIPPGPIGFAFFDSLYELRRLEFERFREIGVLRAGTIVAFHDWTSGLRGHYMDVRTEIEKLAADGLLRAVFLPTPRGIAIAEVL